MDYAQHNAIANFIWGIADDVLRDLYVRGKYRDIILPMTVLRRLDGHWDGSAASRQKAESLCHSVLHHESRDSRSLWRRLLGWLGPDDRPATSSTTYHRAAGAEVDDRERG